MGYKVAKNMGFGISVDCLAFCIFLGNATISSYCKSIAFVMQCAIIYNALKSTMSVGVAIRIKLTIAEVFGEWSGIGWYHCEFLDFCQKG